MEHTEPPAEDVSGLDMGPTIRFYAENQAAISAILDNLPQAPDIQLPQLENSDHIRLPNDLLKALLALLPESARNRSILRKIVGQPSHWFHKDSPPDGQPIPTTDLEDALSPTAIIPAFTDPSEWKKTGHPSVNLWLYEIPDFPEAGITPEVRKIILAEAFIHELSHSLSMPMIYGDQKIRLPSGRVIDGFDLLAEFSSLTENLPPISHYSSNYRNEDQQYPDFNPDDPKEFNIAVDEELAETVAAYLLGFTFGADDNARLDPFADRPEVKQFVADFLHAEKVA